MKLAGVYLLRVFTVSFLYAFLAIFLHCCRQIGRQTNEQVNVRADRAAIQLHFDLCSIFGHCTDNVVIVANAEKNNTDSWKSQRDKNAPCDEANKKHEAACVCIQYIQY